MQQMLPVRGALWERPLDERYPAQGERRMTVGLHAGCVGSVLQQQVNRKAIALLQKAGCEVIVPRGQQCCGAIDHHSGRPEPAAEYARRNIEALADCDAVTSVIAGCGAMLEDYDHLLRDDPQWADRARRFVERYRDISELLVELDLPEPAHRVDMTVTYHDACHLAHAQGVTTAPRALLETIEGLTIVPLFESDMCCGAAGTYNLEEPEMSRRLGERKLSHIRNTGASVCVTGNIGCAMQIASEARRLGVELEVIHPVELLHQAHFGQ
jgi:glycolate oxidase iron-sulfur subunit